MKDILIQLRQENRYSVSLLSKILGVSRQAYSKYETGEVEPSVEIVRKLSKIYKVPYDVLIDNKSISLNQKSVYKMNEYIYSEVASSTVSYRKDSFEESNFLPENSIDFLKNQIEMIQTAIIEMKNQLSQFSDYNQNQNKTKNESSYSKSRTFDKEDFFNQVGKINIDQSTITEFRKQSLI